MATGRENVEKKLNKKGVTRNKSKNKERESEKWKEARE
jgi:hypothetical protein